jgi:rod shape determining protein RodA
VSETTPSQQARGISFGPLGVAAFLVALGTINLASAAQATRPGLYVTQALWAGLGFLLALSLSRIRTPVVEMAAIPLYVVTIALLILVLVVGDPVKGSTRWLEITSSVRLQPSELAKLAVILMLARFLSRDDVEGGYTLLTIKNYEKFQIIGEQGRTEALSHGLSHALSHDRARRTRRFRAQSS